MPRDAFTDGDLLGRRFATTSGASPAMWSVEALVDTRRGTIALLRSDDGRLREVPVDALRNGEYRPIDDRTGNGARGDGASSRR